MKLPRGVRDLTAGEWLGSNTTSPSTGFWLFEWTIHRQIHSPMHVVSDSFHITGALTHKLRFSCVCVYLSFSRVQLLATPWTIACQAPLSMGFSKQEHWRGLPFPSPGDHPNPGMEAGSPGTAGRSFTIWAPREAPFPPGASLKAFLCEEKPLTGV